ncbi:MAG: anthranilate synthase component I family protein [Nitrososphaerales archaeon]
MKFKRIRVDGTPFDLFSKLSRHYDDAYILESAIGPRKLAEYSFIGFNPRITISLVNNRIETRSLDGLDSHVLRDRGAIFEDLRRLLHENSSSNIQTRLVGGFVGFIGYDAVRYWEDLHSTNESANSPFPEYRFGLYDEGLVFDHFQREVYYYYSRNDRFADVRKIIEARGEIDSELDYTEPTPNVSRDRYEEMVETGKEYVMSGDVFQVVLAKKYDVRVTGDLLRVYQILHTINPSPYMYYLKSGKDQIIGSSPEMLVRITGKEIETYPIAGTRARLENESDNLIQTRELLADPKENAEHVMLVDLARNDVGRVSEYGSVMVPEFKEVHQYSHVQHLVSKVVGRLSGTNDAFDGLKALFPAGTVSGAPKVRAMEIIDELEPSRRGPYAGALGYFSKNGSADFAITIRTIVARDDRISIEAGAGIVADSIPSREWEETEQKAGALLKALTMASEKTRASIVGVA